MTYQFLILPLLFFGPALVAIAIRYQLRRWQHLALMAVAILYGVIPVLMVIAGEMIAINSNCRVQAFLPNCPGQPELQNLLSVLIFAGLVAFLTIPSAFLGLVGLIVTFILRCQGKNLTWFHRSQRHKVLAGVCGAIAENSRMSLMAVRIITVALAIIMPLIGVLGYFWLWLAFPFQPATTNTIDV